MKKGAFRKIKSRLGAPIRLLQYKLGYSATLTKGAHCAFVVMYHGVSRKESHHFEEHIRYFKRHFLVVPLDTLLQKLHEGEDLTGIVCLTFDDGLRTNFQIAYPILQRYQVPAVFYVCPGLIGHCVTLWTYEMRLRVEGLADGDTRELFRMLDLPESAPRGSVVDQMKEVPVSHRVEIESLIRSRTADFALSPEQEEEYALMGWDELLRLDPGLITIGSHSLTHPDLRRLEDGALSHEIQESRRILQDKLQRDIAHFSYPSGFLNDRVARAVAVQYRSAVTAKNGSVITGDDLIRLNRVAADFQLPRFARTLATFPRRSAR